MQSEKLSREAWIAAGFLSLAEHGPTALQINSLAKRLKATKGSFYWHFKDLKDFKTAMLALWKSKVATEVMTEVQRADTPQARFDALLTHAIRPAPDDYGGRKIEPAMRAWSLSDLDVAEMLKELDTTRIAFLRQVFHDLGFDTPALADLAYAAYIGLDDLSAKGRADIDASLSVFKELLYAH